MFCTGGFKSRSKAKKRDESNKENDTTFAYEPSYKVLARSPRKSPSGGGPLRQPLRLKARSCDDTYTEPCYDDSRSQMTSCFPKKQRQRRTAPVGPSVCQQGLHQTTSGFLANSPWIRQVQESYYDAQNTSSLNHTYATLRRSVSVSSSLSAVSDVSRLGHIGLRGHLKLAVTVRNNKSINVHVVEAKQLKYQEREGSAFYVKVSLEQDNVPLSTFVTQIVYDSQSPHFDEQFDIPISACDRRKRINIAVIQMKGTLSEHIGSMSFGVRHLLFKGKNVKGWFYLLNEEIGRRKHLRVAANNDTSVSIFPEDDMHSLSPYAERIIPGSSDQAVYDDVTPAPVLPSANKPQKSSRVDQNSNLYIMANQNRLKTIEEDEMEMEQPRCHVMAGQDRHLSVSDVVPSDLDDHMERRRAFDSSCDTRHGNATMATAKSEVLSSSYYDSTAEFTYTDYSDADDDESMYENTMEESRCLQVVEQECWQIISELGQARSSSPVPSDISLQDHLAETTRTKHLTRLLDLEEEYLSLMTSAAQRFSRPLRHCILTPSQHKLLFQNSEKLIVISQLHVKRLHEEIEKAISNQATDESRIGNVYTPHLKLFSEAYSVYCAGLLHAIDVMNQCKRSKEFTQFVRTRSSDPVQLSLSEFIKKPAQHLESLLKHFDSMMLDLPMTSLDYDDVRNVLEALRDCLRDVPMTVLHRCNTTLSKTSAQSQLSIASKTSSNHLRSRSSTGQITRSGQMSRTTSVGSVHSVSTVFSVDNELATLQNKLTFPANLRTQSLVAPNRHVIYSDDVMWVDGWKWVQVHLLLLSDILFFGKCHDGRIEALQEPINLRDVLTLDFECFHPCEFSLSVQLPGCQAVTSLVFRTSHPDQKSTWRHLLEQRVNTCQSQMEFSL